eukprot:3207887-Pyramimonas_sp.AAC.1
MADWMCADVGASPGGWTQFLSQRLLMAGADDQREAAEAGRRPLPTGHVWGIDPGKVRPAQTQVWSESLKVWVR